MHATMNRRITIELQFHADCNHPLQNMARLEQLLKAALENGIKTADADIPAVYSADVLVLASAKAD